MIKLFISYSHPDEVFVETFIRFMVPLCENNNVNVWYDRNITAGDDFWERIDEHLIDRDIVCLFISSHYLASNACKEEMKRAYEMKEKRGISVVPIILSPCMWLENKNIKKHLALPTDGTPVSNYQSQDEAWKNVCEGMKPVIDNMKRLKELQFKIEHKEFLNDASLFTKAHENKEELLIQDIFVAPDLNYYNEEKDKNEKVKFVDLVDNFSTGWKVIIAGEDQSGKTTLAKVFIQKLRERNFIPVYVKDEQDLLQGDLQYRVSRLFAAQYDTKEELSVFDFNRIVPIVDDFHRAHKKEQALERLSVFKQIILFVDTIFDLEVYKKNIVSDYESYRIRPFKPSLRNELIRKWLSISDRVDYDPEFINNDLAQIDERTDMIDRTIGSGLMPAYPFFLLTLLSNYETLHNHINEEIASQGYYYQALIILFLTKQNVTNDKLDTYINFLTEFAYAVFHNKAALSQNQFDKFFALYEQDFNLNESKITLLDKLKKSGIIRITALGNYDFDYPYLYYFFVGKYFSEHIDERFEANNKSREEVKNILNNLHKNENAYITIFLVHHSKDLTLIGEIAKRADELFKDFQPATLDKAELKFFKPNIVKQQKLNEGKQSVAEERQKKLAIQDAIEENTQLQGVELDDDDDNGLSAQLRRSIKTVEVIGCIMRNRSGSSRVMLEDLFERGTNVHLRLVSSFFDVVKRMIKSENYDDFIKKRIAEKNPDWTPMQVSNMAQKIFWNLNFGFILSMIDRVTSAMGAKTLMKISDNVCSRMDTPASFVIKHNMAMRYQHNIRLDELMRQDFRKYSPITRNALLFFVNQFCRFNRIDDTSRRELKKLGLNVDNIPLLPEKQ